uniref:NADH-ubiquinone oxidoreductase chain 6 n=1 Tax=Gigantactis vanhoeffeni TaxID=242958 RepID=D3KS61_GIGVA|nr:NADH dehydrogenase subunit 6 [Gigantactis vanhoeffeni]BAI77298.1 NADH dehydrogenase subunit 6 [Gigantactis vanhoeffeni]
MTYIMSSLLVGLVLGLVAVASNPSPYFAALGLVGVAGAGCGVLVGHGAPFLSLVLFLIYLGGMLVVFAYSAALAAKPYPESLGSRPVASSMVGYLMGVGLISTFFWGGWYQVSWLTVEELGEFCMHSGDSVGVAIVYWFGVGMLVITAWVLLLTLFVVLELTRGSGRGVLRAV